MKLELAKGVKDVDPKDQIIREKLLDILKKVFVRYGFNPLDTPILERMSLFEMKGGGGSEIQKEIFRLKDQGDRDLGLRFDLTVPFARYVGMNPTLKLPFKRYQIGKVFRDGPIKLGRYREFYQCDVDIVGCKEMISDAEILSLVKDVFNTLKLDVNIYVNNRKILDGILEYIKITDDKKISVIISLDKLEKVGQSDVERELMELGLSTDMIDGLFNLVKLSGSNEEKIKFLQGYLGGNQGLIEIEELIGYASFVIFDPCLARGLDYYTGTVYETFLKGNELKSSLAAGGRYDNMVGDFTGKEEEYPAMGVSFGLDIITDALKLLGKVEEKLSVVELYVIPINTIKECFIICERLRGEGLNVDMDLVKRGISKNLDYADKYKIPFVIIIGKQELGLNKYKLKNMETGSEELLSFEEIIKKVKNARS